mgnify:CR=1 FL=1
MPGHFLLMVFYAALVALFFALLWQDEPKARIKLFLQIFLGMVLGALAVAWLMYPFPSKPPAPFP